MKKCRRCGELKARTEFYKNAHAYGGLQSICKDCHHRYNADRRKAKRIRAYGEPGTCVLCRRRKASVLDHDHATGKVRGWLCRQCNAGLGMFGEDPELFERAKAYVTAHRAVDRVDGRM